MESDELLVFRKFTAYHYGPELNKFMTAAIDKLQTLFPEKNITRYDDTTLGIETDYLYSDTGIDIYDLGMLDECVPALRRVRDDYIVTFRIQE